MDFQPGGAGQSPAGAVPSSLSPSPGGSDTDAEFRDALLKFQRMAGLPQTGVMDTRTEAMMNVPRCGVPDIIDSSAAGAQRRRKRFVLSGKIVPSLQRSRVTMCGRFYEAGLAVIVFRCTCKFRRTFEITLVYDVLAS